MITSAQNARLKTLRALQSAKGRRKENAFLLEGVRLIADALQSGADFRFVIFARPLGARAEALLDDLRQAGVPVDETTPQLFAALSQTETSQNVLAALSLPRADAPVRADFVLILDSIRDPGNLGTLLRSAAAAGVQAVFVPPGNADPFAPKVLRAGMGAHFRLPILRQDWEFIRAYAGENGLPLFLADMHGEKTCWEADLTVPLGWIIGGEADGASAAARQSAAASVRIPMSARVESLNAAVAGAVLLFETMRQRQEMS